MTYRTLRGRPTTELHLAPWTGRKRDADTIMQVS